LSLYVSDLKKVSTKAETRRHRL